MFGSERDPVLKAIGEVADVLVALELDLDVLGQIRGLYVGLVDSEEFVAKMRQVAERRLQMTEGEYDRIESAKKLALDVAAEFTLNDWAQRVMESENADILYALGPADNPVAVYVGRRSEGTPYERHIAATGEEINPLGIQPVIFHSETLVR